MKFRCLLVLPLLLCSLTAQEKPKPRDPDRPVEMKVSDDGDLAESEAGEEGRAGKVAPDPNARRRGAAFLQFRVHTRPARLMPGESGTLIVTALLKGNAVLPAPNPLQMTSPPQQGQLAFGAPAFREAGPARLEKAFLGRPAYDNFVIMELPLTLGPDAKVGTKLPVNIALDYELLDGEQGTSLGRFSDAAIGAVEVGRAPDPAVQGGYQRPDFGELLPATQRIESVPAAAVPTATNPLPAISGAAAAVPEQPESVPTVAAGGEPERPMPLVAQDEGLPWALILGGAGLLALVLLLALRKK
jgi:hypothetical protein